MSFSKTSEVAAPRHTRWVKVSHWIITLSFFLLVYSGGEILMVHPRLYWGEVGNDLTPAFIELPISRNYKHHGWDNTRPFFNGVNSPVSASRTYDIFNKNGWGRSLHFLAAWILFLTGFVYLLAGIFTSHFSRQLWPRVRDMRLQLFRDDFIKHFRRIEPGATSQPYGLLQKYTYMAVVFVVLPVAVISGLTMSPAITAAYPFLLKIFTGVQSARTIHFFTSIVLVLFLVVHVVMVIRSGFKQQINAMTFGK